MSIPSDLFAGDLESGVYHWNADLDDRTLEELAGEAGWRLVTLDTEDLTDKIGLLEACRDAFKFPDWTGRNYDALVDALRDVSGTSGVLVLWNGWETPARESPSVFNTIVSIMRRRGEFTPGGPFVALLRR